MKKFKNKLLCSDIDSTLIDDNHCISDKNISAIKYFRENGGMFTIASGRCVEAIAPIYEKISVDLPIVCLNGCGIYNPYIGSFEKLDTIDDSVCEIVDEILKIFPESGVEIFLRDSIYIGKNTPAVEKHLTLENIKRKHYVDNYKVVPKPWVKVLFAQDSDKTLEIKNHLSESIFHNKFKMLQAHPFYYEIFNRDSNKGRALKHICDMFNISPENVFSVGDNDNDIEMIRLAKIGAAVENASDNLKSVADIMVSGNNDSAIYDFVEKLDAMY